VLWGTIVAIVAYANKIAVTMIETGLMIALSLIGL
jgi:hypothetical protein